MVIVYEFSPSKINHNLIGLESKFKNYVVDSFLPQCGFLEFSIFHILAKIQAKNYPFLPKKNIMSVPVKYLCRQT